MNETSTEADAEAGGGATSTDTQGPEENDQVRLMTGLAVAAAGVSIFGFVSLFRLRVGWDQSRARAFRRFLGVQVESLAGVAAGYTALNRLRTAARDQRGVPFAVLGIVLGVSNLMRAFFWLRQDRPEL